MVTAEQMVSQVTELTTLRGFGFSLDGKVDVDDNGYRGEMPACINFLMYLLLCVYTLSNLLFQIWSLVLLAMSQDKQCLC